jgi:UTP--glucose-1-phosphate uridylyltransferase
LGHAVRCGAEKTGNEPFFVLLGDVIVPDNQMLIRMRAISDEYDGASVIAVMPVAHNEVDRFGVIAGSEVAPNVWRINALVEKPPVDEAPTNLAIFGRYLLSPRVMELLEDAKPGAGGEIQLTDALDAVLREEEMYALVIDPSEGYDVGTIESWHEANIAMMARRG